MFDLGSLFENISNTASEIDTSGVQDLAQTGVDQVTDIAASAGETIDIISPQQ